MKRKVLPNWNYCIFILLSSALLKRICYFHTNLYLFRGTTWLGGPIRNYFIYSYRSLFILPVSSPWAIYTQTIQNSHHILSSWNHPSPTQKPIHQSTHLLEYRISLTFGSSTKSTKLSKTPTMSRPKNNHQKSPTRPTKFYHHHLHLVITKRPAKLPSNRGQVIVKIITMEEATSPNNMNHHTASDWSVVVVDPMVNHASTVIPIRTGAAATPNKSSLFNSRVPQTPPGSFPNADQPFANPPPQRSIGSSAAGEDTQPTVSVSEMRRLLSQASATTTTPTSPKPSPSYGKPNLAPKPPGANGSTPTSPSLTSPGLVSGNRQPMTTKATVARHHSMKTPR